MDPLSAILNVGSKIIDKIFPDKDAADKAKIEMLRLQQEGAFKELEMDFELAKKQGEINQEEAKSSSMFVAGWRPCVGWICCAAYAYNYLVMPLGTWAAQWYDKTAPAMVALETGELTTLLFGMLGIGGLRTVEKLKGIAK